MKQNYNIHFHTTRQCTNCDNCLYSVDVRPVKAEDLPSVKAEGLPFTQSKLRVCHSLNLFCHRDCFYLAYGWNKILSLSLCICHRLAVHITSTIE